MIAERDIASLPLIREDAVPEHDFPASKGAR